MNARILYFLSFILIIISFFKDKTKTFKALKTAFKSFESIMPQFLGIILTVGLLLSIINAETISKIIGKSSGFIGVFISSIFGSITMMPTFVSFSTGNTLLENGAGYPQVGALISTLTMVGVITYPLEARYIGKKGAFLRNLLAFIFSFIVAFLIEKVVNIL